MTVDSTDVERTPSERFDLAAKAALAQGRLVPCGNPRVCGYWTSDDREEREQAERLCRLCPSAVFDACHDLAEDNRERHHVWAGRDRTPPKVKRRVES